jgi:hypothetical protein
MRWASGPPATEGPAPSCSVRHGTYFARLCLSATTLRTPHHLSLFALPLSGRRQSVTPALQSIHAGRCSGDQTQNPSCDIIANASWDRDSGTARVKQVEVTVITQVALQLALTSLCCSPQNQALESASSLYGCQSPPHISTFEELRWMGWVTCCTGVPGSRSSDAQLPLASACLSATTAATDSTHSPHLSFPLRPAWASTVARVAPSNANVCLALPASVSCAYLGPLRPRPWTLTAADGARFAHTWPRHGRSDLSP